MSFFYYCICQEVKLLQASVHSDNAQYNSHVHDVSILFVKYTFSFSVCGNNTHSLSRIIYILVNIFYSSYNC